MMNVKKYLFPLVLLTLTTNYNFSTMQRMQNGWNSMPSWAKWGTVGLAAGTSCYGIYKVTERYFENEWNWSRVPNETTYTIQIKLLQNQKSDLGKNENQILTNQETKHELDLDKRVLDLQIDALKGQRSNIPSLKAIDSAIIQMKLPENLSSNEKLLQTFIANLPSELQLKYENNTQQFLELFRSYHHLNNRIYNVLKENRNQRIKNINIFSIFQRIRQWLYYYFNYNKIEKHITKIEPICKAIDTQLRQSIDIITAEKN